MGARSWQFYALVTGSAVALMTSGIAQQISALPPSITPGGIVPLFGMTNTIESGELVTIYGNNLADETAVWNGDFPVSLGGTGVEINGRPAYLMFVSPGQINLQAPDDTVAGTVQVIVTTASGRATSTVTLGPYSPSLSLLGIPYGTTIFVSGIILRPDGSGAYGGGRYDILGPPGQSFGYRTVAAQPGDTVELFGVGFGPTTPEVPAGQAFSGAAPIDSPIALYIDNVMVRPAFAGLSAPGVYQINLKVPVGLGEGDVPIVATVGGMQTQPGVLFSLASVSGGSGNPP